MSKKRLAIVSTHPIQYHTGWFRALATHSKIDLQVFFCHDATPKEQARAGFGVEFNWDIPLFDGYRHRFLKNVAAQPSVVTFSGVDTPEIKEIIAKEQFDAVLVNGWHYRSAWQTLRACWKNDTPVMMRSDSHLNTRRSTLKRTAKWPFYRWFISKLDACLPVGKWSHDYFLHYGARPDRTFIVPHVIDTDYFSRESARLEPQRSELQQRWNLNQNSLVFLFVGKFIEKKRPEDFVRAIDRVVSEGIPVAGLMVGDGPLRASCQQMVQTRNLPISFAGFLNQSEIAAAYVAADALVLPSDGGETWGFVVNEAMACGKPCFVSDQVGCGPDMIVSGKTGWIFPVSDVRTLARLMQHTAARASILAVMRDDVLNKAAEYSTAAGVEGVVAALESASRTRQK